MAATRQALLGYLSDQETKVDLLNNEAIARTIIRLIREKSDQSVTIGVHGDWGAGKSSVLEMVRAGFPKDGDVLCLKFNGWQFQGFEDAKIALIEGVVTGLIESRSLLTKASEEARRVLASIDWLKVAKRGGGLAFNALTGLPSWDQLAGAVDAVIDKFRSGDIGKDELERAFAETKAVLKDKPPESKSVPHEMREFRKSFKALLAKADIKQLVVLVDDLDRCVPETAIQTLEAVRLFVALDKTAFIIGADEGMIQYAVRKHFPDLPETDPLRPYARNYLEKLIQVPFRIPALGETETRIYVTLLLLGGVLKEGSDDFAKLLELGRRALAQPWEGKGIEDADIRNILGKRYSEVAPYVVMAEQISPVLSAGTNGNPRQIKRFLNALALRLAVAEDRGFGAAIEKTKLAKLMLAELYLPEAVFAHIASSVASSPDGSCPQLTAIEKLASLGESAKESGKTSEGAGDPAADAVLDDWKLRPEVLRWATVQPEIGGQSLKPYLFVIKDRRNFLSASTPLPPKLLALFERLAGGELSARATLTDAKQLVPAELDALFSALRSKVLASDTFETKPLAMFGISTLAETHPGLQGRYMDLLEAFQIERLGLWIASGHLCIKEPTQQARLNTLLAKIRTQTKSTGLRMAIEMSGKPSRKGG